MAIGQELVLMLLEDAEHLSVDLAGDRPQVSSIRTLAGPILRKWLIEGQINLVAKEMRPDTLRISYLSNASAEWNVRKRLYGLWTGNFSFNEIGMEMIAGVAKENQRRCKPSHGMKEISGKISLFLKQPVCFVSNKKFTRGDVIKFHANNLGGAHYDPTAIEGNPENKRLRETVGYEVTADGREVKMLLGPSIIEAKEDPKRRSGIYDLADLVVLDAAKRFSACILREKVKLEDLLKLSKGIPKMP